MVGVKLLVFAVKFQFLYLNEWPSVDVLRASLASKLIGVMFPEIPMDQRDADSSDEGGDNEDEEEEALDDM